MRINHLSRIFSKLPVKLGLVFSMLLLLAFVPRDEDPITKIVASLQRWTDTIPQEKVYLHMDKPYYALGDTIWFKGYVTIGSRHQLSALSGALYVDLITEKDSIVRSLKLPVTSGMVVGNFILSDEFKEGSYRIRSYTQWMRNAGEDYFFDRTFTVGSIANSNIVTRAYYQYKDIDGKPVLTATLNYTNDDGKPLAGKDVRYQIMINKQVAWSTTAKTDPQGSIVVRISNEKHVDLSGAYITTTLDGSDKNTITRDFPIKAALAQTDVQFFPESGSLVNGISSRVAFKAIGVDGLGVAVKGKIVDETNTPVAEFEALHAGMGSFLLHPETGKTYSAIISFDDGTTKTIALPKAVDEGYVLSVYQPNKDSVLVRIAAPAKLLAMPQGVNLIAHTNGETIFASPIKIEKAVTSIWLDKRSFPSGIAQFTLFNNAGEPMNERIAFIRSNDQMQLDIKTAKTAYNSKERVLVNLDAKDSKNKPTFGNFSVTVIDESKVPVDEANESTIFSNLLLTSDLKGYVETPNYYFTKETEEVNKALDNLMLTQGYRRFSWKELANAKPAFPAEGLGVNISGKVTTLNNKLVPNANVMLMSLKAGVTKGATTDANGRFKFDGIFMTDSIKFAVQARTAKNSDKVKVILDSVPKIHLGKNRNISDVSTNITGTIKAYLNSVKKEDDIYEKYGQLDKVHRLAEVRIRARKPTPSPYKDQGMYRIPEGLADQTYVMPDPENCAMLGNCLGYGLKFVVFHQLGPVIAYPFVLYEPPTGPASYVPAKVFLDGRKLDINEIGDVFDNNYIDPVGIAKIDVVRTNGALTTMLGGPGILIYTKRDYIRQNYNPSVTNITPKGFNKVREFYSPRYDRPGNAYKLPDLRTTVYWNPYLKTGADGKTTFNYFNADGPGTYKVIVEGINAAGELGRQVYRYTVGADQATAANFALPTVDKNLALITAPLDSLNKRLPVEKVYLHIDKPYYNIGDTLWFKSYLVDRVNLTPSHLSGLLYVELDNDSSEMVRRVSVPIKDGIGMGQIPLPKTIFQEGGYTLRAYTNWMQNFGEDYVFNQRLYLAVPSQTTWLVKSSATIDKVAEQDQLKVNIMLNRSDNLSSPLSFKKVEVKIFDDWHYIYKETLQTGIDGSLKFSQPVKEKMLNKKFRVQITSLDKADGTKIVQVPLSINRKQNIDLQFLPEGGNLVAGLKSTVGFKAIGEDGKGTPVAGAIIDSKGTEVVSFTTVHNGMGTIEFTSKAGEKYSARLSQPLVKSFDLPKISATGTVMHISNPEQGDALTVNLTGLNNLSTDSACYLIGTARGVVYYSQKIDLGKPTLTIDKKLFPSGVARIALFKGKRPLNERAVFIDNNDQLSIKITPDKATFHKRDSLGLEIEVKDKSGIPVQGNFSLAVTDDSQVRADSVGNNGIAASLLLKSELKGNVESPGYYIIRKNKQAWQDLDNLMLTQGWTGYNWADVFAPAKPAKFEMQSEFKVKGHVTNIFKKPIPNASVLISSQKPQFVTTVIADEQGKYEFKGLPQIDSGSFFIQASKANGKKMSFGDVSVDKFRPPLVPETLKDPILPWYVNTDSVQLNYVKRKAEKEEENLKLTDHVLKQVDIKSKKFLKGSRFNRAPDLAFDEQEIKASAVMSIYELLKQKLPGLKIVVIDQLPSLVLNDYFVNIIIDGKGLPVIVDPHPSIEELKDELNQFQIATFKGMGVFFPLTKSDGMHGLPLFLAENGLLDSGSLNYLADRAGIRPMRITGVVYVEVITGNGAGWFRNRAPNAVTYRPLPILYPQQFYSPKYDVKVPVAGSDFRSTLYWEPSVITDQNGKARVSFYTSDIEDKYTIKVSGISTDGAIGDGGLKLKPASIIRNTVIKPPQ